ncbi:hypothetical protein A2U01_0083859, partial [Trifolium medium]|nr:hypothetical protein [Trifolium medium]
GIVYYYLPVTVRSTVESKGSVGNSSVSSYLLMEVSKGLTGKGRVVASLSSINTTEDMFGL